MKDKSSSAAGILENTIEKVKDLVNVSTIIGEPISVQGGVTITPVAFLVVDKYGNVEIKHITAFDNAAERLVSLVPEMFDKVNVAVNRAKMDKAFDKAVADIAVTAEENITESAE